ncbi:MAG TPA: VOC family protein [Gaiellaceae bacterium]|nr:VOC family protein [Gaiellaceae bacterium]
MSGLLPDATRMGAVHLTVADLERSLDWYRGPIGLRVHARDGGTARLGAGGEDLLVLRELPGAPPADGHTGLFHFALLLPSRPDLARWLAHAARNRVPLTGLSDHWVSEAIYLRDPDHHGIEIYADRPRQLWEGRVREGMTTLPLDTNDLLGELADPEAPFEGLPAGTTIGHVHLRVADIPETIRFYRDGLGFELVAALGSQAAFLSAGGYHHHFAGNTWESAGAAFAPDGSATLERMTVLVPDGGALDAVEARLGGERTPDGLALRDPSGNPVLVATAA